MIRRLLVAAVVLGLAGLGVFYLLTTPSVVDASALPQHTADLKNGEAMFNAGGCASCHTTPASDKCDDPKHDPKPMLGGGRCLKTPFGTFNVPNISQDKGNGIGGWTDAQFVTAMVKGVSPEGSHYYPAFPFASYQRMKVEDVLDLWAYLKTVPAVATPSKPHDLALPFKLRRGIGMWKLLFLDGQSFTPDAKQTAEWNRGAYLVNGPGHCAECHSGRNAAGAIDEARRWSGGADPEGRGWIPNITPHADGLAEWSDKDIAYMLESGFTPAYDAVGSTMADVVKNTARLTAEDRDAMATYLKSLPAKPGKSPRAKKAAEKDAPPAGDGKK